MYDKMTQEELLKVIEKKDRSIKRLKNLNDRISRDELTGAYVRSTGLKILNDKLKRKSNNVIISLLDMNNLKLINDRHGHIEGDNALRELTKHINENVSDRDDVVIRLGGDEFLIVFTNETLIGAQRKIEKARNSLLRVPTSHGIKITFSAGFIDYSKHRNMSIEQILEKVDKSMYKNKRIMKKKLAIKDYR
jgi:two-component system, cell cycle response regulator